MASTHTLHGALEMFQLANVDLVHLKYPIQTVIFCDPVINDDVRLVELDMHLTEHVQNGGKLVLRGENDDFPVLCTENETYNVKEAETSNNLLLLPSLLDPKAINNSAEKSQVFKQVHGICFKYLELKPIRKISTSRLNEILEKFPYCGVESEIEKENKADQSETLKFTDLLDCVQGSEAEICEALKSLPIVQMNGFYRYLPLDYRYHLLSQVLDLIDFSGKQNICIDLDSIYENISQFGPKFVIEKCLEMLGKFEGTFILDERLVCTFFGEYILSSSNKQFILDEFMQIWQLTVPSIMNVQLTFLEGLALVSELPRFKTIEYFSLADLPDCAQERFALLFSKRPKWKLNDLKPYLIDLAPDQKSIGNLLTKYCRSCIVDGDRLYNSRDVPYTK